MGYTHYWHQSASFTDSEWQAITDFTRKAIKLSGVKIADGSGENKPEITNEHLWINGSKTESFETFYITKSEFTDLDKFTKTGYRPYDVVVVAILLYIHNSYPDKFKATSNGDIFNPISRDGKPGTELMLKSLIELKSEALYLSKK